MCWTLPATAWRVRNACRRMYAWYRCTPRPATHPTGLGPTEFALSRRIVIASPSWSPTAVQPPLSLLPLLAQTLKLV